MPTQLKKDETLNKHLINYLRSVLDTPNLSSDARKELDDAIKLLNTTVDGSNSPRIRFPFHGDSAFDTADTLRMIMNNFFRKHFTASQDQIKLQKQNFQRFLHDAGLIVDVTNKPTKPRQRK